MADVNPIKHGQMVKMAAVASDNIMLLIDPGALLLRQCNGCTSSTPDASIIEADMSMSFATIVHVEHLVLEP